MSRQRPVPFLLGMDGPSIELPGWVAAWLEANTDLPQRRIAARGRDLAIDDVLAKLHYVAVKHLETGSDPGSDPGSDVGTELDRAATVAQSLDMTVSEAATTIGITDRAVRKAIQQNRLPARRSGAIWLITRDDLTQYQRTA